MVLLYSHCIFRYASNANWIIWVAFSTPVFNTMLANAESSLKSPILNTSIALHFTASTFYHDINNSNGIPDWIIAPFSITNILSYPAIVLNLWAIVITVLFLKSLFIASWINTSVNSSKLAVPSSIIIILGFYTNTRAKHINYFYPNDNKKSELLITVFIPSFKFWM